MRSLDNCSHIITNPMNTVTYHPYATITSFSSQNYSRNLTNNNNSRHNQPGTTTDSFYIENELNNIYTINSNINSNNQQNGNINNNNNPTNNRNFYVMTNGNLYRQNASRGFISNEELHRHFSDTNNLSNLNVALSSETVDTQPQTAVVDVNATERRAGETSASGVDNLINSNSNSNSNPNSNQVVNVISDNVNPNARNHPEHGARANQRRDRHRDIDMDEENNNFVTLADIRESRV